MQSFSGRMPTKKDCKYREIFTNCQTASEVWHILAYSPQKSNQTAAEWVHWKRVYDFAPRECDTQNAQDAVSPSQHSPGKSPVPLLGTAKTTLSGPARSCDTQNAQDAVSPSQLQILSKNIHQTLQNFWRFLNLNSVSRGQNWRVGLFSRQGTFFIKI